jgi:peptidoglycan/LPS O-acetylase OafA/YrhL
VFECRELDAIYEEYNLTESCYDHMWDWCRDFSKSLTGERYALQMLDSWGTPELGLLEGNIRWPGRYYECVNAVNGSMENGLESKWCNAYYGVRYFTPTLGYQTDAQLGVCFPQTCSEDDISDMLYHFFGKHPVKPTFWKRKPVHVECPVNDRSMDTPTIIFIAVLSVLGSCLVAGSKYDIYLRIQKSKLKSTETFGKALISFSAITNTENLLVTKRPPGFIPCLDGIRCLSTNWVILYHCWFFPNYGYDNHSTVKEVSTSNWAFLALVNGTYAVDTFFVLSGSLVTYFGMKTLSKSKGSMNIPLMYLQRYLRLTPAYAFLILFSVGFYKFFGFGPYWQTMIDQNKEWCSTNWWTNLVYINNIYPAESFCYAWGWYLADDMQFFLLSPFILYILYKNRYAGVALISAFLIGSIITCGMMSEEYHIQPHPLTFNFLMYSFMGRMMQPSRPPMTLELKYKHDMYFAPWVRMHAYMIGMLTGYILFKTKLKLKINKVLCTFIWMVAMAAGMAVVYGIYGYINDVDMMDENIAAFYNAMARPTFAACVAWMIIACVTGNGGPIARFLDWSFWSPLSRLTYSLYLVHVLVIYWYLAVQESPMHFSYVHYVYFYFGTVMIALGFAYLVSLLVEWPMIGLLRIAFPKAKRSPSQKSKDDEEKMDQVHEVSEKNDPESLSRPPSYSSEIGEKSDMKAVMSETKEVSSYENNTFTHENDKASTNF